VLFTDLVADRDTEEPGVRDWMQFGGGPAPGERAPDAMFDSDSDDGATVFGQLHHGGHTLLLFDGAAATESGYQNLASIAAQVTAAHGDHVRPHVIVLSASRPAALDADAPALLDCHGAVHKRYGARSECLYLIRPDGYVAYRCQPADGDQLAGYLSSIFAA
jgi:hypothetical protein